MQQKELTKEQAKRQDKVDNAIVDFINQMNPKGYFTETPFEYDGESVGYVRDLLTASLLESNGISQDDEIAVNQFQMEFYPYVDECGTCGGWGYYFIPQSPDLGVCGKCNLFSTRPDALLQARKDGFVYKEIWDLYQISGVEPVNYTDKGLSDISESETAFLEGILPDNNNNFHYERSEIIAKLRDIAVKNSIIKEYRDKLERTSWEVGE